MTPGTAEHRVVFVPHKVRGHQHLDSLVYWASGEFPDSAINIVGLDDGRYFLSVDFGDDYHRFSDIFRHDLHPYRAPTFFDSEAAAQAHAISCIKQVHPELAQRDLAAFFLG